MKPGEQIVLCDGTGMDALVTIAEISKKRVDVRIEKRMKNSAEPPTNAILYCAVLKRENFEYVTQKATEVGVAEIVPVRSERTVKLDVKMDRIAKIAREAAEQSGRGRVPIVHPPMSFEEAVSSAQNNGVNVFFEPMADVPFEAIPKRRADEPIGIWIGPEGGWTEAEIAAAKAAKMRAARLGKTVLRAETAATVASFLAINS